MKSLLISLLFASASLAQPIGLGVKAGIPFTDFFDVAGGGTNLSSVTRRYTLGPYAELRLPFGLGVEVNALYKRFNYQITNPGAAGLALVARGNSWEFPVLAKWRFVPEGAIHPFVSGGVNFRTVTGLGGDVRVPIVGAVLPNWGLANRTISGIALAGGVELHFLVRISGEIRYTHWGSDSFVDAVRGFRSNTNQAEFLLGFGF
ncbi:MAG: hypothetical protein ACRD8O_03705 [Bryobacteraceae bacterium]